VRNKTSPVNEGRPTVGITTSTLGGLPVVRQPVVVVPFTWRVLA
jgi:hypothetical protein